MDGPEVLAFDLSRVESAPPLVPYALVYDDRAL
jgi:hypothetical protein